MNGPKRVALVLLVASFLLAVPGVVEGQLAPPAAPSDPGSARFSLNDVWSRLSTGATQALRSGAFQEPAAGPTTATTKTTNEVMAVAPTADNATGATAADVLAGKTFWGLRTSGGTWGLATGTGYPAPVEKTGQRSCFVFIDSSWYESSCVANTTGQDGMVQKGVAWPNPRFTKHGNGTVTDNLTGLLWLENASCFGTQTWVNALDSANNLASGACGLTDGTSAGQWRLPNVKELLSLIDYHYINPALSNTAGTGVWLAGNPFTNVGNLYWSSTSKVLESARAWSVSLGLGSVSGENKARPDLNVWPVRGGL